MVKYQGCIVEFTAERGAELLRAFREELSRRAFINVAEVAEAVVEKPCSRFWVSEERALWVVNAMLRGKPVLRAMRPTKREMFQEIYRRVVLFQAEHPDATLYDAVFRVVNSPAPKFYMRPRCAMEIIYKMKNGKYGKNEKNEKYGRG